MGFGAIVVGSDIEADLSNNGGPTPTHALQDGSPAIDAAGICGLVTDQRGALRDDGLCDSGAYEHAAPLLVTLESYSATLTVDGVEIRWTTATEIDTVGFQVLREEGSTREKSLHAVGPWVPSAGGNLIGASYIVLDDSKLIERNSRYFIEDIDVFGKVTRHGPVMIQRGSRISPPRRIAPAFEGDCRSGPSCSRRTDDR